MQMQFQLLFLRHGYLDILLANDRERKNDF